MSTTNELHHRLKPEAGSSSVATVTEPASLTENGHPAGPKKHSGLYETFLMVNFILLFSTAAVGIHGAQIMGAWLYLINKPYYYTWMAMTKKFFGLLLNTITQFFSPTLVRVSGDADVVSQITLTDNGRLETRFPNRLVLISNHIIYTDWLYLWWFAYTSSMHGHIFIILKESLRWVPIIGPAMMFYGFIFMARSWAKDQSRLLHRLQRLNTDVNDPMTGTGLNPMWLLLFPEGTNISGNGRAASKRWADKQGVPDLVHCLLPRSTGMQFCLEQLHETVDWVYDCTIQYEGIPRGKYGQDVYTLRSIYFQGRAPTSVNMYWRRFATKDIPVNNKDEFEAWLKARWEEKDKLLEQFAQNGRFPANENLPGASTRKPEYFETMVKPRGFLEILGVMVPVAIAVVGSYIADRLLVALFKHMLWKW